MKARIGILPLGLAACGLIDAPGDPTEGAWRGGLGHWPENSRTAVEGSIDQGYAALELDVFLTADRVPVFSDQPVLDPERCTHASGTALTEYLYLVQLDSSELLSDYHCGGQPDPDHPDAQVQAEVLLDFDALIELLEPHPDLAVHFDARWEPGFSHDPEVYAAELLERWWAAELTNPFTISAGRAGLVQALEARATQADRVVTTILTWPHTPAGIEPAALAWAHELGHTTGVTDPVGSAVAAEADGIRLAAWAATRRQARLAQQQGLLVQIDGVETPAMATALSRWPVDTYFTAYPEPAP